MTKRGWLVAMATAAAAVLVLTGCSDPKAEDETERNADGEIVEAGDVGVFQLQVGDCFDDQTGEDAGKTVPGLPCADPHDNQVYAIFELEGDDYPGDAEVQTQSGQGCDERIDAVDEAALPNISRLAYQPSQETWEQQGDREVICYIFNTDQSKLEGSIVTE